MGDHHLSNITQIEKTDWASSTKISTIYQTIKVSFRGIVKAILSQYRYMLSMGGMCAPPLSCDVAQVAIVHKYTQPNLTIFKNMKKIKILSTLSYYRQL
jgi:hypothetical protein